MLLLAPKLAKEQGLDDGFQTVINTGRAAVRKCFTCMFTYLAAAIPLPSAVKSKEKQMGSFSIWHWLIVLVVVLLIFGTKKLRNIGSDLGGAVKGFKEGMKEDAPKIGDKRRAGRANHRRRSQGQAARVKRQAARASRKDIP